jgi:polyprenyldihydroxybenzoate methyltransferase / 3-demethylubiquinol 3-O-methyltransferase
MLVKSSLHHPARLVPLLDSTRNLYIGRRSLHAAAASSNLGTVNASEIAHFSRLSSEWWDEQGEFGFLHKMNPVRMRFVREKLVEMKREAAGELTVQKERDILKGLDILDVGCGGGLLSEVRDETNFSKFPPILIQRYYRA